MISYLASNTVMVTSFIEGNSRFLDEESPPSGVFPATKPGCLGLCNELSLLNIRTTDDMFGLSSGLCCTHNKPT